MFSFPEFVFLLLALVFLHEWMHVLVAHFFGMPLIALFFVFPKGIAVLTEDEGRTLRQEILIKILPTVFTISLVSPIFFFDYFSTSVLFAVAIGISLSDYWNVLKAVENRRRLQKFFVESEKRDLEYVFDKKRKGFSWIFVARKDLWGKHLKRDGIKRAHRDFRPRKGED